MFLFTKAPRLFLFFIIALLANSCSSLKVKPSSIGVQITEKGPLSVEQTVQTTKMTSLTEKDVFLLRKIVDVKFEAKKTNQILKSEDISLERFEQAYATALTILTDLHFEKLMSLASTGSELKSNLQIERNKLHKSLNLEVGQGLEKSVALLKQSQLSVGDLINGDDLQ